MAFIRRTRAIAHVRIVRVVHCQLAEPAAHPIGLAEEGGKLAAVIADAGDSGEFCVSVVWSCFKLWRYAEREPQNASPQSEEKITRREKAEGGRGPTAVWDLENERHQNNWTMGEQTVSRNGNRTTPRTRAPPLLAGLANVELESDPLSKAVHTARSSAFRGGRDKV